MTLGLASDELFTIGQAVVVGHQENARSEMEILPEALKHLVHWDIEQGLRFYDSPTQKAIDALSSAEGIVRTVADMIAANNAALLADLCRLGVVIQNEEKVVT